MTIAACYLSPEGVVLGADSTSTGFSSAGLHHYNYAQKIFEIGERSSFGLTMWGLAATGTVSYRTLIARLADDMRQKLVSSVPDVVDRWADLFWNSYQAEFATDIAKVRSLAAKATRTPEEETEFQGVRFTLSGGFCIGGHVDADRSPKAYEVTYDPTWQKLAVQELAIGRTWFWGSPNLIQRVIFGIDVELGDKILQSGKWTGTMQDLLDLAAGYRLSPPGILPIREAIDWVHASIYTTIKAMKFSQMAPICGGPIEIAVIATDRSFRWVRHKPFDSAIAIFEGTE
jgi:hypothetical protein